MSKMRNVIYHILFMLCKYTGNCYLIKHDATEIDTWTLCFELWNNNQDTVLSMCFCLRTLKFDISELQRNTVLQQWLQVFFSDITPIFITLPVYFYATYRISFVGLGLWCFTALSTIFQLNRGISFVGVSPTFTVVRNITSVAGWFSTETPC